MKAQIRRVLISSALVVFSMSALPTASAHRYWHGGWGWGFGTGLVGGAYVGTQIARPYYYQPYPPPVVYQQPTIVQAAPPVYLTPPPVSTPNVQVSPPMVNNQSVWYFCESENNFYPNVSTCPEPWKEVNTNPSAAYTPATPPSTNN